MQRWATPATYVMFQQLRERLLCNVRHENSIVNEFLTAFFVRSCFLSELKSQLYWMLYAWENAAVKAVASWASKFHLGIHQKPKFSYQGAWKKSVLPKNPPRPKNSSSLPWRLNDAFRQTVAPFLNWLRSSWAASRFPSDWFMIADTANIPEFPHKKETESDGFWRIKERAWAIYILECWRLVSTRVSTTLEVCSLWNVNAIPAVPGIMTYKSTVHHQEKPLHTQIKIAIKLVFVTQNFWSVVFD